MMVLTKKEIFDEVEMILEHLYHVAPYTCHKFLRRKNEEAEKRHIPVTNWCEEGKHWGVPVNLTNPDRPLEVYCAWCGKDLLPSSTPKGEGEQMTDVEEFLVIEPDGKYAPEKYMSTHSDGWILIADRKSNTILDFSPSQVEALISFLQSSASTARNESE